MHGIIDPTQNALWDFIEQTAPRGVAGAAAKLRLLTDDDIGIAAGQPNEDEVASLKQVADLVERLSAREPRS
jgi:hypothetical protein